MPRPLMLTIGILLFALATAFLYGWGVIKAHNQTRDLTQMLYSKGTDRIKKYLKSHDTITLSEIEKLVDGMQASLFYSRNRATVTDTKDFSRNLIALMQEYHLLEEDKVDGKVVYRRAK